MSHALYADASVREVTVGTAHPMATPGRPS